MNKLAPSDRAQILHLLCEGMSIRAITRLTGASKNTVAKLLIDAGKACAAYLVRNKFKSFDTSAHHLFDQAKLEALHIAAKAVAEADLKSAKDAALVEIERIKAEVIASVSGNATPAFEANYFHFGNSCRRV